jgi:hypothetical protein
MMVEPTGHCPYLGLKQNQAIRFASPTPEHRCYAAGQAQEIPLVEANYQRSYCLSPNHIKCPLYTGSGLPSTPQPPPPPARLEPVAASAGGIRGWFAGLAPRDRLIYRFAVALVVLVALSYLVLGVVLARDGALFGGFGPPVPSPGSTAQPAVVPEASPTRTASPTPTDTPELPTSTPTVPAASNTPRATRTARPTPSRTPTETPLPTIEAISPSPTSTFIPPTRTVYIPPPPTNTPSDLATIPPETATPAVEPSSTSERSTPEPPTPEPPTPEPPTPEPPTPEPPTPEPPTPEPQPTGNLVEPTPSF